jgi:hypothetical protein
MLNCGFVWISESGHFDWGDSAETLQLLWTYVQSYTFSREWRFESFLLAHKLFLTAKVMVWPIFSRIYLGYKEDIYFEGGSRVGKDMKRNVVPLRYIDSLVRYNPKQALLSISSRKLGVPCMQWVNLQKTRSRSCGLFARMAHSLSDWFDGKSSGVL